MGKYSKLIHVIWGTTRKIRVSLFDDLKQIVENQRKMTKQKHKKTILYISILGKIKTQLHTS